jgi:hypothetical protein
MKKKIFTLVLLVSGIGFMSGMCQTSNNSPETTKEVTGQGSAATSASPMFSPAIKRPANDNNRVGAPATNTSAACAPMTGGRQANAANNTVSATCAPMVRKPATGTQQQITPQPAGTINNGTGGTDKK